MIKELYMCLFFSMMEWVTALIWTWTLSSSVFLFFFFSFFFLAVMGLLIVQLTRGDRKQETGWERGGVTRGKGTQAGIRTQVHCSEDKASFVFLSSRPLNDFGVKVRNVCIRFFFMENIASAYRQFCAMAFLRNVFILFKVEKHLSDSAVVLKGYSCVNLIHGLTHSDTMWDNPQLPCSSFRVREVPTRQLLSAVRNAQFRSFPCPLSIIAVIN